MWFLQFFLNLGFKHQNLKEENLEDNVIIHGSNLRRLKIQTLSERTGKERESGNWVLPCSWRVLYVLLTGRHPVKKKLQVCKYHGGEKTKRGRLS